MSFRNEAAEVIGQLGGEERNACLLHRLFYICKVRRVGDELGEPAPTAYIPSLLRI